MAKIRLGDSRAKGVARSHSTLAQARKSANRYKGRLCIRGDRIPLSPTAFISPSNAHRGCVKILCSIADLLRRGFLDGDIPNAFLQYPNLNSRDRIGAIHPSTIQLLRSGNSPRFARNYAAPLFRYADFTPAPSLRMT